MDSGTCDVAFRRISGDHEEVTVSVRSMTETKGDGQCPLDRVQIGGTPVQQAELRALLREYADVFAVCDEDLGYTDRVKHEIPVTDDVPVAQAYRRIPPNQFEEVREHITGLLKKGIIKESSSPYASPVVLVRKTDGSLRLCVRLPEIELEDPARCISPAEDRRESGCTVSCPSVFNHRSGEWLSPSGDARERSV